MRPMAYPVRLAAILAITASGCDDRPDVSAIEIVPSKLVVGSDPGGPTTFRLEARLWGGPPDHRWSIVESDGYHNLHWKSDQSWLHVNGDGFHATVSVDANAAPSGPARVTIKAGGKKTEPGAEITVVPQTVTGQDVLSAKYAPDRPPDVAVVNGKRTPGGPCTVTVAAFVSRTPVGPVVEPCDPPNDGWGAAVLAMNRGSAFKPVTWTTGADGVDAGAAQGSLRTIPLALRIMVAPSELEATDLATLQDDALAMALADLEVAQSILAENRVGIQLSLIESKKVDVTSPTVVGDCRAGDALSGEDRAGLLNVYYVNRLGFSRAMACARHQRRGHDAIYIGWEENPHFANTLVHEVGHALGLMLPGDGHADMVPSLGGTNVMWSGENDDDPEGRRHLTVGQVFRTNAEHGSWLNVGKDLSDPPQPLREQSATRLTCQCGPEDPSGPCPRSAEDIATSSTAPGMAKPWDCNDEVRLAPTPSPEESLAGIVAGRSWAPPAGCRTGLPATSNSRLGATYLRFENLYRPGDCPSWIAVFFRQGGVVLKSLAEPSPVWTPNANLWKVEYAPAPPRTIPVQLVDAPDDVNPERQYAEETFGSANPTGIQLQFVPPDGDCGTSPPAPRIRICYIDDGGSAEATIPLSRVIKIQTDKRTPSTMAHFLGRVLKIPVADPPAESAYSGNVMQPDPAKRGRRLTLGQLYRMHVELGSFPACATGTCPSLTADLPPP
jgi:hypothetical protein